ncbi:MAG: flagellar hook assembly protein FlgD [Desulfuromonadaceae bacterium]|nr:flagellar hook assembly protein FlgD [Desulfuromonadaceae bacterium]
MMSEITATAASSSSALTSSIASKSMTMGKEDFLLLMVEQLKNQDPMNPADATEFTAQLAQFSSLEQLFNINETLGDMGDTPGEVQRLSALSMIGDEIVTTSSDFSFDGTNAIKLGYELDAAADQGVLYIRNASGQTVASWPLVNMSTGQQFVEWDGKDDLGNDLPSGSYSVGVSAFQGSEVVGAKTLVQSQVLGVDMTSDGDVLVTASGTFRLADVESVRSI